MNFLKNIISIVGLIIVQGCHSSDLSSQIELETVPKSYRGTPVGEEVTTIRNQIRSAKLKKIEKSLNDDQKSIFNKRIEEIKLMYNDVIKLLKKENANTKNIQLKTRTLDQMWSRIIYEYPI